MCQAGETKTSVKSEGYLRIIDRKYLSAFHNLEYERILLTKIEKNPSDVFLVFYENLDSVILGRTLDVEKEVYLKKKHPAVLRRMSGGGSVVHGRGNLNYALFLNLSTFPDCYPIQASYERILGAVIDGFAPMLSLSRKGLSDLCVTQKGVPVKISGNAQARKKGWILHHGTFLYDPELIQKIRYFLRPPPKQPEYRQNRTHEKFLIQSLPPLSAAEVKRCFIRGFAREFVRAPRTTQASFDSENRAWFSDESLCRARRRSYHFSDGPL